MRPSRLLTSLGLAGVLLLQGCASFNATTIQADCRSLSGRYGDAGEPKGDSLMYLLLKKKSPGPLVQLVVTAQGVRISSGTSTGTLAAATDFHCGAAGRIELTRRESSRILLPPLIDQVKTVTYVLTGGAGADLVLHTYAQTTLAPYGAKLKGPMQVESVTTWHRSEPWR